MVNFIDAQVATANLVRLLRLLRVVKHGANDYAPHKEHITNFVRRMAEKQL